MFILLINLWKWTYEYNKCRWLFPVLEITIFKFHEFSRFSMTVRTLLCVSTQLRVERVAKWQLASDVMPTVVIGSELRLQIRDRRSCIQDSDHLERRSTRLHNEREHHQVIPAVPVSRARVPGWPRATASLRFVERKWVRPPPKHSPSSHRCKVHLRIPPALHLSRYPSSLHRFPPDGAVMRRRELLKKQRRCNHPLVKTQAVHQRLPPRAEQLLTSRKRFR